MARFPPREILERETVIFPIFGGLTIVAAWLWWGYKKYGAHSINESDATDALIFFGLAIVATVAIPIVVARKVMLARVLLQRGVATEGWLISVHGAAQQGRQAATFEYVADDAIHRVNANGSTAELDAFTSETRITVIYDADKPSRAKAFVTSAGIEITKPSVVVSVATPLVDRLVYSGLMIGQLIAAFALLKWLKLQLNGFALGAGAFGTIALTMFELRLVDLAFGPPGPATAANRRRLDRWMLAVAIIAILFVVAGVLF